MAMPLALMGCYTGHDCSGLGSWKSLTWDTGCLDTKTLLVWKSIQDPDLKSLSEPWKAANFGSAKEICDNYKRVYTENGITIGQREWRLPTTDEVIQSQYIIESNEKMVWREDGIRLNLSLGDEDLFWTSEGKLVLLKNKESNGPEVLSKTVSGKDPYVLCVGKLQRDEVETEIL